MQRPRALTLERGLVSSVLTDFVLVLLVTGAGLFRLWLRLELVDDLARVLLRLFRDVGVVDGSLWAVSTMYGAIYSL